MNTRPLETTDYLWVLSRQLDRVAELATQYFNDASKRPAPIRAKAFVGSVLVLYAMALPVLEEERRVRVDALHANYRELALMLARDPATAVSRALDAWSELIRALHLSRLLFSVGAAPLQV